MESDYIEQTVGAFSASDSSAIQRIIGRTFIVEYGIIKEVLGKGVVSVALSVTDRDVNIQIIRCVLLSTCSKALAINIEPQEGDKVLVLFPRRFCGDMFDVSQKEPIIEEFSSGYNSLCGMAILMNQYKESDFNNHIDVDKNENIKVKVNDVSLELNKDKEITLDTGKAKATIDKNGNVSIESNGKYTIKNNTTDLSKVIDELAKTVEGLTTTGGETAQSASPETVAKVGLWRTSQLQQLFKQDNLS